MSEQDSQRNILETKQMFTIHHGHKTSCIAKDEIPGYEITGPLGCANRGVIWKAIQKSLERTVAIKILSEDFASNELLVKKFLRDAESMAGLTHPNIIQIYDIGRSQNKVFYVME